MHLFVKHSSDYFINIHALVNTITLTFTGMQTTQFLNTGTYILSYPWLDVFTSTIDVP